MSDVVQSAGSVRGRLGERIQQEQRRRLKRQRMSTNVRIGLASVSAVVAIAAALADSAPTGHVVVDAVERAAVAVAMVYAATRARRWALVVASVVVAIGSSGWWLAPAVAAVVGSALLVVPNRRNRIMSGATGGLIAVVAFHLDDDWFDHSSLLLGLVASGIVLVAGWQRADSETRRSVRRGLAGAVVGVALVGVAAGFAAWSARGDLNLAVSRTESGLASLRQGRTDEAASTFTAAGTAFRSAHDSLHVPWLVPAGLVPVLSQHLEAATEVTSVGQALVASAASTALNSDYDRIRRPDGGVDVDVIRSFGAPVRRAELALRSASRRVHAIDTEWLVPLIAEPLGDLTGRVDRLRREARVAGLAVRSAPNLLGGAGARRYLILLGNPAEARDLGGHIGNWAELVVDQGRFDLVEVGSPLDLVDPTGAELDGIGLPPTFDDMRPALFPQNWGAFPDMPTVAKVSAALFERRTGRAIDGVMYADTRAFAAFVGLSGAVDVPGLDRVQLTSANAAAFVEADQFRVFPDDAAADAALTEVVRTVFDRLTSIALPGPRSLATTFSPLVRSGRLQFASLRRSETTLLDAVGLRGAVPAPNQHDLLGVISRNANPSKIDVFLRREVTAVVRWNPTTGEVGSTVTVTLTNTAPASGLSPTVLGGGLGLPLGTNVTDLAIVSPFSLLRSSIDGSPAPALPQWDGSYWHHQVRVTLPPGESRRVTFELEGLVAPGERYSLEWVGQPLVADGPVVWRIRPTEGVVASARGGSVVDGDGRWRFTAERDRHVDVHLDR